MWTSRRWTRTLRPQDQVTSRRSLGLRAQFELSRHAYTKTVISPSYDVQISGLAYMVG